MTLLLVDDEKYTCDGILSVISNIQNELGLTELYSAADGVQGLSLAEKYKPDIILTDIRMPRMDGIAMSHKIREFLPSCCIIFMSGYAEKEYLKSAIKLSAVNYIEKPFPPEELENTLFLAVSRCRQQKEQLHSSTQLHHTLNLSIPALKNKIALSVLRPLNSDSLEELQEYLQLVYPAFEGQGSFITFLISILPESGQTAQSLQDLIENRLSLSPFPYSFVGVKNEALLVVHAGLPEKREGKPSETEINGLSLLLYDILKSACHFLLAAGIPVSHFLQLYSSYQTASICLQHSFFKEKNSLLFYSEQDNNRILPLSEEMLHAFEKELKNHDKAACLSWLSKTVETLQRHDGTLVSSVKNFFVRACLCLYQLDRLSKNHAFCEGTTPELIQDTIWNMAFLMEIEQYLREKINNYFDINAEQYALNPVAYRIKQYIEEHYCEEMLSLTVLSDHFSISESYLCVIFKKTFDITINQYIINLRMARAKQYLTESNMKIKEIAERVGYRDCNYFIRLFKKTYQITPSDIR